MGVIEIASIVTVLLTEFFKSAISETAKKSIEGLFGTIKAKMAEKSSSKKIVEEFQSFPDESKRQNEFEKQLIEKMKNDKDFAQRIKDELQPILQQDETIIFLNKIGKINKSIQIKNMFGNIEM